MHADLERVIALQRLDSAAHEARRRLAEEPERSAALDSRLEAVQERLAAEKHHLAENQAARRNLEKDVAVHQTRLSKFRDQLMAVKTNVEYQAMQKEIGFAQSEVKTIEEQILVQMLDGDQIAAAVKKVEAELAAEQKAVEADRRAMAADMTAQRAALEKLASERGQLAESLDPAVLQLFETVASRRHGVAVAEAKDGICTVCHVRLRPQMFNTVRRNAGITQCDSCQRILYFIAPAPSAAPDSVGQAAPPR